MRNKRDVSGGGRLVWLFGPSAVLVPVLAEYVRFEGAPHFLLHTLAGWDIALIVLLIAADAGRPWSRLDGFLPLAVAIYALTPDFIYAAGPYHRDWMDVFLLHVALDEILPHAVPVLGLVWIALVAGYVRFRAGALPVQPPVPAGA